MRAGDGLLLVLIGLSLGLVVGDMASGGALAAWAQADLYAILAPLFGRIARIAPYLAPVLLLPLLMAVWGRFAGLPDRAEPPLRRLITSLDAISLSFGGAARWLALGLVVVTATVVIQRYVFGFASTKLQESVIYMHALLFLLASASTLLADGHVRVDIFYAKAGERGKAWIDMIGAYLALIPMSLLILWVTAPYVNASWRVLERSRESDGLPFVFLLKTAIPLFAILMLFQAISMALRSVLTISGRTAPDHPHAEAEV
jgi:TRAP-type mannitol/chloroaromatic compound transport system permease small subunit